MVALSRPLVTVNGDMASRAIAKPPVFEVEIRPDLVTATHQILSCNKRQAYGVSRRAGHQTSAKSWGTGRAVARLRRVRGGGTPRAGQAACGNMCRGGGMYAPKKVYYKWHHRANTKLRRVAVASAIAATAVPALVKARGHQIDAVPEMPVVIRKSAENTSEAVQILKEIGAYADVEKAMESVAIRAGKGKMRNRRYTNRKGPLIVYGTEGARVVRAFRNLPGVDVANVERLNLLDLAPGGHLGRFVIWTESAFQKLEEVYGSFDVPSQKKKGFLLPRPKMTNADLGRIINSDELQSVLKPKNEEMKRRAKRNPVLKLNPYLGTARKMAAFAEAARVKARNEKLDSKRTKLSLETAKVKAAENWLGVTP